VIEAQLYPHLGLLFFIFFKSFFFKNVALNVASGTGVEFLRVLSSVDVDNR